MNRVVGNKAPCWGGYSERCINKASVVGWRDFYRIFCPAILPLKKIFFFQKYRTCHFPALPLEMLQF